jgi:nucleotide-binding universal stress UspA family protein
MFRSSVLFPHDGSVISGSVLDSLGLALSADTPVTLLHVDQGEAIEGDAIAQAVARLEGYGVKVTQETLSPRDPAAAIVDYARVHDMGMIAMSTHGHGGKGRVARGRVAERVLQASSIPVLLMGPKAQLEPHFGSILVPVALEEDSLLILETLIPLALSFKSSITLLHVASDNETDTAKRREERRRVQEERLTEEFAQAKERVEAAGVDCHLRIEHGDADSKILEVAKPDAYDLLAMTTHARRGLSRWIFGSVAQRVVRDCEIPLYLQRTGVAVDE